MSKREAAFQPDASTFVHAAEPAERRTASGLKYRSEVDGLRFWAVVPVIFYHAGLRLFRGGFIGVDIFFVISGYLITTIISRECAEGRFSILNFYQRRGRRILPMLYFVILLTIVVGWWRYRPSDYADLMASVAAVTVFASNVLYWRTIDYFAQTANVIPLLHTWSLGVEEQFYILFPFVLVLVTRLGSRGRQVVLGTMFAASLALAQREAGHISLFSYYLLPTRAWELMVGALVALHLVERGHSRNPVVNQAGGLLGFLMILVAIVIMDKNTPYPSIYTLIPTLGTALIIFCGAAHGDAALPQLEAVRWGRADQLQCLSLAPAVVRVRAVLSHPRAGAVVDVRAGTGRVSAGLFQLAVCRIAVS